jgi:hypothetical protein
LQENKEKDGKYMEPKQKSFEVSLKKGEIGEQIIREILENQGWVVYMPFTKDRAHYFDMLATQNKERVIAIDVKTKARFNKWPAQGINVRSYNEYMKFVSDTGVPFYIVFIDDKCGDIHAKDITKLKDPIFPNDKVIAWDINQMKHLGNIGEEKIQELSKYDQRNYDYNPT